MADYDQALALNPKYADAYYNRGLVYKEQGNKKQAITEFRNALAFFVHETDREDAKQQLRALGEKV